MESEHWPPGSSCAIRSQELGARWRWQSYVPAPALKLQLSGLFRGHLEAPWNGFHAPLQASRVPCSAEWRTRRQRLKIFTLPARKSLLETSYLNFEARKRSKGAGSGPPRAEGCVVGLGSNFQLSLEFQLQDLISGPGTASFDPVEASNAAYARCSSPPQSRRLLQLPRRPGDASIRAPWSVLYPVL